jgi:hypothetical protein
MNPVSIATLPTPSEADYKAKGGHFGPHNVHENRPGSFVSSKLIFATYQNAGVRVFDISNAFAPKEIGALVPPQPTGSLTPARTAHASFSQPMSSSMPMGLSTPPITMPASTSWS